MFFLSPYRPIVTIWKVVFANNSRTLGRIWIKLGRWGWGLKRLSLTRLQRNRAMGFRERENMGHRGVFLWRKRRTTSATFLGSIPPNFPRTRVQVLARDTWFHIPEKFPLRGRISRKPMLASAHPGRPHVGLCPIFLVFISFATRSPSFLGRSPWNFGIGKKSTRQ